MTALAAGERGRHPRGMATKERNGTPDARHAAALREVAADYLAAREDPAKLAAILTRVYGECAAAHRTAARAWYFAMLATGALALHFALDIARAAGVWPW